MIGLETKFFATELRQIKLFKPSSCQNSVRFGEKPGFFVVSTVKCNATAEFLLWMSPTKLKGNESSKKSFCLSENPLISSMEDTRFYPAPFCFAPV